MGYRGSSDRKDNEVVGIERLEMLMRKKLIRWAASVNGRNEPQPRSRARMILRQGLGPKVELRWVSASHKPGGEVALREWSDDPDVGYTDGSRIEGVTGVASAQGGLPSITG